MEETLRQQDSNCIKVCLFGPESSGKSTLSRKLSLHYNAPLVIEYARPYLQSLWDQEQKVCRPKDLLSIAQGQMKIENEASLSGAPLIICDTDLLSTKVYSEAYYDGWCPELLRTFALENTYDLYLLTYIDTPWTADDLRDRPERREEMYRLFKNALVHNKRSFLPVKGNVEQRFAIAVAAINILLR